jgi:hypothetical protein
MFIKYEIFLIIKQGIHHEAVSLRSELQRQQALMQNNIGEEAQGFDRYKYFLLPGHSFMVDTF